MVILFLRSEKIHRQANTDSRLLVHSSDARNSWAEARSLELIQCLSWVAGAQLLLPLGGLRPKFIALIVGSVREYREKKVQGLTSLFDAGFVPFCPPSQLCCAKGRKLCWSCL